MNVCIVRRRCRFRISVLVASGIVASGGSGLLAAQTGVEIGPLVGYYRPLGHFADGFPDDSSLPMRPQDLSAIAYGGTAAIRFRPRIGIEAIAAVVPDAHTSALLTNPGTGQLTHPVPATVTMAGANLLLDLISDTATRVWVGAGPGVVRHGGEAYSGYGSPTSVAGAAVAGVDVFVTAHLRASVAVSGFVYQLRLRRGDAIGGGTQEDALFHVGLAWRP